MLLSFMINSVPARPTVAAWLRAGLPDDEVRKRAQSGRICGDGVCHPTDEQLHADRWQGRRARALLVPCRSQPGNRDPIRPPKPSQELNWHRLAGRDHEAWTDERELTSGNEGSIAALGR